MTARSRTWLNSPGRQFKINQDKTGACQKHSKPRVNLKTEKLYGKPMDQDENSKQSPHLSNMTSRCSTQWASFWRPDRNKWAAVMVWLWWVRSFLPQLQLTQLIQEAHMIKSDMITSAEGDQATCWQMAELISCPMIYGITEIICVCQHIWGVRAAGAPLRWVKTPEESDLSSSSQPSQIFLSFQSHSQTNR